MIRLTVLAFRRHRSLHDTRYSTGVSTFHLQRILRIQSAKLHDIIWITFRLEICLNIWPIMKHYIATSVVLLKDAVPYFINDTFRLTATSGKRYSLVSCTSVEQKFIGLKFSKSRNGSNVTYSCHHILSRFTFPIFAHSWRFSVFHQLQSITPHVY